jgi:hypothetical protein
MGLRHRQFELFAGLLAVLAASSFVDEPQKGRCPEQFGVDRRRVSRLIGSRVRASMSCYVSMHLLRERGGNARMAEIVALP